MVLILFFIYAFTNVKKYIKRIIISYIININVLIINFHALNNGLNLLLEHLLQILMETDLMMALNFSSYYHMIDSMMTHTNFEADVIFVE